MLIDYIFLKLISKRKKTKRMVIKLKTCFDLSLQIMNNFETILIKCKNHKFNLK